MRRKIVKMSIAFGIVVLAMIVALSAYEIRVRDGVVEVPKYERNGRAYWTDAERDAEIEGSLVYTTGPLTTDDYQSVSVSTTDVKLAGDLTGERSVTTASQARKEIKARGGSDE